MYVLPRTFFRILAELDGKTKEVMLYQFKMEIEEYYHKYYLASYTTRSSAATLGRGRYSQHKAIPGSDWQLMRINNLSNCKVVVIPGLCYNCKVESPLIIDIEDYLAHIGAGFISEKLSDLQRLFVSKCTRCKRNMFIGEPYIPIDMIRGYDML